VKKCQRGGGAPYDVIFSKTATYQDVHPGFYDSLDYIVMKSEEKHCPDLKHTDDPQPIDYSQHMLSCHDKRVNSKQCFVTSTLVVFIKI
jgi:hypothetical protein